MWAAYKGRTDVAQLLLEKGANPNITGQVLRKDNLCSIIVLIYVVDVSIYQSFLQRLNITDY